MTMEKWTFAMPLRRCATNNMSSSTRKCHVMSGDGYLILCIEPLVHIPNHKFLTEIPFPRIQSNQETTLRFFLGLSFDILWLLASATCANKAVKTPLTFTLYLAEVSAKIQFFPRVSVDAMAWLTSRLSVPEVRSHLLPTNTMGTSSVPLAS